jgi:hypothetical protein
MTLMTSRMKKWTMTMSKTKKSPILLRDQKVKTQGRISSLRNFRVSALKQFDSNA